MAEKTATQAKPIRRRKPDNRRDPGHKLYVWMLDNGYYEERRPKPGDEEKPETGDARLGRELGGVAGRTVYRWLSDGHVPDMILAQRVYDLTDGYVGLMDWPTAYVKEKKDALRKAVHRQSAAKRRARISKEKAPRGAAKEKKA